MQSSFKENKRGKGIAGREIGQSLFIRDICLTINRRLISVTASNYVNNDRNIVVKRAKLLERRAELFGLGSERFDHIRFRFIGK